MKIGSSALRDSQCLLNLRKGINFTKIEHLCHSSSTHTCASYADAKAVVESLMEIFLVHCQSPIPFSRISLLATNTFQLSALSKKLSICSRLRPAVSGYRMIRNGTTKIFSPNRRRRVPNPMAWKRKGVIIVTTPFPMDHPTTDHAPPFARTVSGKIYPSC